MTKRFFIILLFALACCTLTFAQSKQTVMLNPKLTISPDSTEQVSVMKSLAMLLSANKGAARDNPYVLKTEQASTATLLAAVRGFDTLQINLDNLVPLDSKRYRVQLSFINPHAGKPAIVAAISMLAVKDGEQYRFYSPLTDNTRDWKHKTTGSFDFCYLSDLDLKLVDRYIQKATEFDRKLNASPYRTVIFFCNDAPTATHVLGMDYLASEAGALHDGFSGLGNNQSLLVFGHVSSDPSALDIHDCWHMRLRNAPKTGEVNKFLDEACAYLYGGSWGYSWQYILDKFKAATAGKTDWLAVYRENKQFGESQAKHLYAAYVIDALLMQKIEKDKGFPAVMKVLCSGKKTADDMAFFAELEKADGITPANFNQTVSTLLATTH